MMMKMIVAITLLGCAVAHADDATEDQPETKRHATIGAGVMLGADASFIQGAVAVEAVMPLPNTPFYGHAVLAVGEAVDFGGGGQLLHARAGIEARTCTELGGACLVGQLDVGAQSESWSGMTDSGDRLPGETHTGFVAGPAAGFDVGGDRVRFRAIVDVEEFHDGFDDRWKTGAALNLGIAIRMD